MPTIAAKASTRVAEMILVDTNVLLRIAQPKNPMHHQAMSAVKAMQAQGDVLCVVPQVLYEYWVVATPPKERNGLGMAAKEVDADLAGIIDRFRLIRDERWDFQTMAGSGTTRRPQAAHDARLVAAMQRHRMSTIISFNVSDSQRYPGINVLDPDTLGATGTVPTEDTE